MQLQYIQDYFSQNIEIEQLRPGKSYDYLIQNRNASLSELLSNPEELKKFLIVRNCPVCNYDKHSHLIKKDNLDIVQCDSCSVVYTNPVFDENKYLEIYKGDHYQTIVKKLGEDSHIYRKNRFGKERMDFIEKFHNPKNPKSYLDIGCSTGFIIEEGKERGWDTTGIELNPSAVQFGLDRGLNIISEPLETANLKGQFAAISLFDVLEHLIHPKETLERVHDLLVPDGNVFIYVPNFDSAYKMLAGVENAHFIWPTHHLTYFTPLTLKYLLEKVGFEVIHWETQGLDIFDYLWYVNENTDFDTKLMEKIGELLQFYINAGGHGKKLRMFARKIK